MGLRVRREHSGVSVFVDEKVSFCTGKCVSVQESASRSGKCVSYSGKCVSVEESAFCSGKCVSVEESTFRSGKCVPYSGKCASYSGKCVSVEESAFRSGKCVSYCRFRWPLCATISVDPIAAHLHLVCAENSFGMPFLENIVPSGVVLHDKTPYLIYRSTSRLSSSTVSYYTSAARSRGITFSSRTRPYCALTSI